MDQDYLALVERNWADAYYAEAAGDLVEALRLYRLVAGAAARISLTEKDSLRIEFGKLNDKIEDLQKAIAQASGASKLKRVPIVNEPVCPLPYGRYYSSYMCDWYDCY